MSEIRGTLVSPQRQGGKLVGLNTLMSITVDIDLTAERHRLALEYTLKVLDELGFSLVIDEIAYKRLETLVPRERISFQDLSA